MGRVTVSPERQEAFEALYAKHRLDVLAYCTRRVGPTEAADACSESFLVAWRRLDDIPEPPGTLPYLYGIASKVLANQSRAMRRRMRLEAVLGGLDAAPAPDPSVLVVQGSQHEQVQAAVGRLRPTDREIVMLYAWEGLSRESIAQMMGLTRAAIDQRIHRSYRRLARILAPMMDTVRPDPRPARGSE